MHAHFPQTTIQLTYTKGIVKVLGILRIDGTSKHITEILTTVDLLLRNGGINLLGRLLHILRILIGQIVLSEDGVHLSIVVTRLSKDIHHRANNVLMLIVGPLHHLHHRLVVGLATFQLALGNDDVVHESVVERYEEGHIFLHTQLANDLIMGTLDNLNDHRLFDMFVATGHVGYLHAVTVQSRHRVALSHKYWCTTIIGQE